MMQGTRVQQIIDRLSLIVWGWVGMNVAVIGWSVMGVLVWPLWMGWLIRHRLSLEAMFWGLVLSVGVDVVLDFRIGLSWLLVLMVVVVLGQSRNGIRMIAGAAVYGLVSAWMIGGSWTPGVVNGFLLLVLVRWYQRRSHV